MTAKEAVEVARAYFLDLMGEKSTVEEVWFDYGQQLWCVTLGRPRIVRDTTLFTPSQREILDYKVVRIKDDDGTPISITNRESGRAA